MSTNLSIIAAMGSNRVIGRDNRLPWRLPAEYAYFLRMTEGRPVIMGRRNFESPNKPLPGRRNIVVTRDAGYQAEGAEIVHSVQEVLAIVRPEEEPFIIGGEQIYRLFMPYAERLYLTVIDHPFEGDTFFPETDGREWTLVSSAPGPTDADHPYRYTYLVFQRKS